MSSRFSATLPCSGTFSFVLLVAFVSFNVVGCLGSAPHHSPAQAEAASLRLADRYGTVTTSQCTYHLTSLVERLTQHRERAPKVTILDTGELLAFSPGNSSIMISRGLLVLFSNEAELSFMLAHEIGHYALKHHESGVTAEDVAQRRDLESEADAYGVSAMTRAGYDPSYAVSALTAVYNRVKQRGSSAEYPSLNERITNVAIIAMKQGTLGRGSADRRAYHECRASLRQ